MGISDKCRICNADTFLKWPSNLRTDLRNEFFAITDTNYGLTGAIYECEKCGFRQCSDVRGVLQFYEQLEDPLYEQGRKERARQAEALLRNLGSRAADRRLLDVGAGSGILVEEALKKNFDAQGIEPSIWLQEQAVKRKLPVRRGLLKDLPKTCVFDCITLIDVIEHVEDPLSLLEDIAVRLEKGGKLLVATPDCGSLFARLLRRKWWHYRVAHVGYFNRNTLHLLSEKAGFEIVSIKYQSWYFTLDYLWFRLFAYFPRWMRLKPMAWMKSITVPFNLRDSLAVVMKKRAKS